MAKKVTVQIVDDFSGSVIAEAEGGPVAFAFEGQSYEIDLSNENIARFRDLLEPYIKVARLTGRKVAGSPRLARPRSNSEELRAIREWARANGIQVSDRGRIAAAVREAYNNAR